MNNCEIDFIKGKCLAATPTMGDERFKNAVVYICAHSAQGAMGFVINHQITEYSFLDLAAQLPIKIQAPVPALSLYQGGPVEKIRGFVLHSTDYMQNDCVDTGGGVAISASIDILSDIARGFGPKESMIVMGYANWAPGQLEKEIIANDWLIIPSSEDLVFRTKDEDKWNKAIGEIGIDLHRLCHISGRA